MSKQSKTKQLAIDTVLFGISAFGSKILVFLLTPLYTAILLPAEYGVADLINTTVNLIYPVLTLAITDATLRYALDKNCSKPEVLCNSLLITLLSVVLLMAFYPVIALMETEITAQLSSYWGYFVATYAMYNLHLCLANFIKGIGKTKLFAIQGIVQTVTVIACNIYFLVVAKIGLQGYLLSIIIGLVTPTVLMFFAGGIIKYIFPFKLDRKLFLDMLKYSIPMIPALLAWSVNQYINKYMLIGLLPAGEGLSASGIFGVANKIPSLLTAVMAVFLQAWQLSAISNVNDADESTYYTKVYSGMQIVSLIGCLLITPFSKLIAVILFDANYYAAWQYIPLLTLAAYFSSLSGFLASAFRAYKKTSQLFTSVVFGAIVNVILNFVLIQAIGPFGAAIASAASFLVTWIIRMATIQQLVKIKINVPKALITYLLVIGACLLISFDIPYAYIVYTAACIAIVILNFKDIRAICGSALTFAQKVIKKK